MAVGTIVTVLANIPWGQVIDSAPKIADGATKLWGMINKKTEEGAAEGKITPAVGGAAKATELALLTERIQAVEARAHSLQEQVQAASELLKGLAEQNALLVQRVELNRMRLLQCATAFAVTAALLATSVGYIAFAS